MQPARPSPQPELLAKGEPRGRPGRSSKSTPTTASCTTSTSARTAPRSATSGRPAAARIEANPGVRSGPTHVTLKAGASTGDQPHLRLGFQRRRRLRRRHRRDGTHAFGPRGTYVAAVQVKNAAGRTDVASTRISAGNTPPHDATITPNDRDNWTVGEHLSFDGSAIDDPLHSLTLTWTLVIEHCTGLGGCHQHRRRPSAARQRRRATQPSSRPTTRSRRIWSSGSPRRDDLGLTQTVETADLSAPDARDREQLPCRARRRLERGGVGHGARDFGDRQRRRAVTAPRRRPSTARSGASCAGATATRTYPHVRAPADVRSPSSSPGGSERRPRSHRPRSHAAHAHAGAGAGRECPRWRASGALRAGGAPAPDRRGTGRPTSRAADREAPPVRVTGATGRLRDSDSAGTGTVPRRRLWRSPTRHRTRQDTRAPSLALSIPRKVRLGEGRLRVGAECPSERCTVSARAVLRIKGRKAMKSAAVEKRLDPAARRRSRSVSPGSCGARPTGRCAPAGPSRCAST